MMKQRKILHHAPASDLFGLFYWNEGRENLKIHFMPAMQYLARLNVPT